MKRMLSSCAVILALNWLCWDSSQACEDVPAWRQKADSIVKPLLEKQKLNQVVIGVIDRNGKRQVWTYGEKPANLEALDGDTIFEIGSITKAFTALLLADAVARGEVKLDDPVSKLLPQGMTIAKRGDRVITLEELATHTSGLPRIPGNLMASVARAGATRNPYSQYDEKLLADALKNVKLADEEKPKVSYSNLGAGLLGFALSKKLGKSYEDLVVERVLVPCGMKSSSVVVKESDKKRLISGHETSGKDSQNWTFQDTTAGAGALRSTANDMLTFLEVQMGRKKNQLSKAMALTQKPMRQTGPGSIGLGWFSPPAQPNQDRVWWHNGGTGGYSSFTAFCTNPKVGVIILSNRFIPRELDDLGMQIIGELRK